MLCKWGEVIRCSVSKLILATLSCIGQVVVIWREYFDTGAELEWKSQKVGCQAHNNACGEEWTIRWKCPQGCELYAHRKKKKIPCKNNATAQYKVYNIISDSEKYLGWSMSCTMQSRCQKADDGRKVQARSSHLKCAPLPSTQKLPGPWILMKPPKPIFARQLTFALKGSKLTQVNIIRWSESSFYGFRGGLVSVLSAFNDKF